MDACKICKMSIMPISKVVKCPIRITHQAIRVTVTSLCKSSYTFLQPISDSEICHAMDIVPRKIEYYEDAVFCSVKCCDLFIEQNINDYMFTNSRPILYMKKVVHLSDVVDIV